MDEIKKMLEKQMELLFKRSEEAYDTEELYQLSLAMGAVARAMAAINFQYPSIRAEDQPAEKCSITPEPDKANRRGLRRRICNATAKAMQKELAEAGKV